MTEHDTIEELAVLLDGDGDVEHARGSLGALVTLAQTLRDNAELISPTAEFRAALRADLVAVADAPPGLVERTRAVWRARTTGLRSSARVAVATMTASSMLGTAGVAAAAQESLPGDLLYGIKGVTEDVRLLLATDDLAEARLQLTFARERLEELRASAGTLTTDQIADLLARMDAASLAGAEALLDGLASGAISASELQSFVTGQRDGLVGMLGDLPLLARPVAQDSLELLRRIEMSATGIVPAADCNCDARAFDPAARRTPSGTATAPQASGRSIFAPGDGPAIPVADCGCIELPGGDAMREAQLIPAGDDADQEPTPDRPDSDEQEPFQPSGELADSRTSNDEDEDDEDGNTALDLSTSTEPLDDVIEPTGLDVNGTAERLDQGISDLLD